MVQDFIDKHFYHLFIITLFFGVILYGLIGFQSIDEICSLILFIMFLYYMFQTKDWNINRTFLYIIGIFLFYLCYSFYIKSNSARGIFTDFIIQLKPYLAFYCTYQLKPFFDNKQRTMLRQSSVLCWILLIPIGIIGLFSPHSFNITMGHASNYASAIAALALVFLYTSNNTKQDRIIFICMLVLGLASGRSKFYGFFIFSTFIALYFSNIKNIKLSFKNILILTGMLAIILFVAKEKIDLYFVQGITEGAEKDYIARFALYATAPLILIDYIPFGSGFASFATFASGAYYSSIYAEYGIDGVWGLSKSYKSFVSDTYYPSLAQFGFVGLILFTLFWLHLTKKAYIYFKQTKDTRLTILAIIIIGYFAIENIADATFTSNRGVFFMMFLGLIFSDIKNKYAALSSNITSNK